MNLKEKNLHMGAWLSLKAKPVLLTDPSQGQVKDSRTRSEKPEVIIDT